MRALASPLMPPQALCAGASRLGPTRRVCPRVQVHVIRRGHRSAQPEAVGEELWRVEQDAGGLDEGEARRGAHLECLPGLGQADPATLGVQGRGDLVGGGPAQVRRAQPAAAVGRGGGKVGIGDAPARKLLAEVGPRHVHPGTADAVQRRRSLLEALVDQAVERVDGDEAV